MFGADKKFLTISINEGVIKIAQASSFGVLEKVARGSYTSGASVEEGAKALKTLLSSFNRKLPVICVIPGSAATAKTIEVPSSDPEEIKSIINLQAGRHTPYSREEVLISYINLGLNAINNTRLMMVIVHRDIVKERIAILEAAGLNVERILFAPEAQARFYAKALNLKKDAAAVGLIDFTLNAASFMIIAKSTLVFVRHIPIGVKSMGETDALAKLKDEFVKSMDAFRQEESSEPPHAYNLTGARELLKTIAAPFKDELSIDLQANAFSNFVKGSADIRNKIKTSYDDDSFLDVIAPASSAARCEINLMPDEMLLKKTVEIQSKEAIKTGIASIVIMILIFIMVMGNIYFKDTYLNKNLRERFAPQKAQVKMLHEKLDKITLIRDYINGRMGSLEIVRGLYTITPNTIYLNNITVDEDQTVTIDGVADSMSLVYSYVKSIGDSTIFKEAKLKSTSTKRDNGKDVASFEIEFKPSTASTDVSRSKV